MTYDEALKIVKEQTIPSLKGSGGGGHVEALEILLDDLKRWQECSARQDHELDLLQIGLQATADHRAKVEAERDALRAEVRDVTVVADENFDRAEKAEAALREILHAEQWADVVSIIDAALRDTAHIFDADRSYVEGMNGYPCATCGEYESNPKHHAPSEGRDFSWFRGSVDKELVKKLMDMRARARGSSEARWKSERINRHAGRDTAPAEEGKP